jgi:N-methylhydantoinase A
VRTALSGPAAGVMGAIHMAHLSNRPNIITLDMGGTSADVALVRDFHADTAFDRSVGGFPVRLPMVDIHTIGAGGGSIAWFERDGMMKVGPISAGAVPGPACYGNGGERPTVTDANLVLGRLSPKGLLDGRIPLDATAARRVMKPLAEQMGCTVERAARGVVEIVVSNMVRAIRAISVERGHDPRQFTLFPFGGAGPLHATDVAESLDIREILVPLSPGILCAHGLLVSDLKENFVRSVRVTLEDGQAGAVAAPLKSLQADAEAWFAVEAIPAADRVVEIVLDMRHVGQNFELAVPIAGAPDVAMLRRLFLEAHERNYGYANPLDPVEIVNFRLTARGRFKTPEPLPAPKTVAPLPKPSSRAVCFRDDRAQPTPVYQRAELSAGQEIVGPAVVDQLDSTSLVYPGYRLRVDAALNFIVTRDAA